MTYLEKSFIGLLPSITVPVNANKYTSICTKAILEIVRERIYGNSALRISLFLFLRSLFNQKFSKKRTNYPSDCKIIWRISIVGETRDKRHVPTPSPNTGSRDINRLESLHLWNWGQILWKESCSLPCPATLWIYHKIGLNRQICWDVSQQGLHEPLGAIWSIAVTKFSSICKSMHLGNIQPQPVVSQYAGRWRVKRNEQTFGVLKYLWEQACSII